MSKPLKPKRGTTAENDAYIGEAYEVTLDTEKHTLRVHDGVTPGGHELARGGEVGNIREDTVAAAQEAIAHSAGESGSLTLEGVAAEVGLKANISLDNLSESGKNLASSWGLPSSRYTGITVGASGSQYTAPDNGYFVAAVISNSDSRATAILSRLDDVFIAKSHVYTKGIGINVILPVVKGHVVIFDYINANTKTLHFVHAEGVKNR